MPILRRILAGAALGVAVSAALAAPAAAGTRVTNVAESGWNSAGSGSDSYYWPVTEQNDTFSITQANHWY
jgi:opacity protein-like surface antigen